MDGQSRHLTDAHYAAVAARTADIRSMGKIWRLANSQFADKV